MIEDAEPPRYEATVSLRIWHPEARDLVMLLREWGLEGAHGWQTGEPKRTPKGHVLAGTRATSYAYADLPLPATGTVGKALKPLLDRLDPIKGELRGLADDGGRIELFVQWHFDGNSGETFDWELLQRLSELRIDLSLDIYPEGEWLDLEPAGEMGRLH